MLRLYGAGIRDPGSLVPDAGYPVTFYKYIPHEDLPFVYNVRVTNKITFHVIRLTVGIYGKGFLV